VIFRIRRLWVLAAVLALAVGLLGCGAENGPTNANANNDGVYVDAGHITYQLQISRELNPYATEDSQYVAGLPPGTGPAKPDELWYGVFLAARNQTGQPAITSDRFVITDTQGNRYYPLTLNPAENRYAWQPQVLQPSGTEPAPNTAASFGPTQGGLLLFKLPSVVYSNRPLTLFIYPQGGGQAATISLDL
jgi:hypothetical protein